VIVDFGRRQYVGHRNQTIWAVVIAATEFENDYGVIPAKLVGGA
jgi:hypothetical protein